MQRAAGCMPASSQAIQQLHSSRCCSCSCTPVWHRPSQRVYLWKQARQRTARQRTARQRTARQAARCSVATYPEPETEKERSPLDYPQEWITPQPSRRPEPIPDFEKLETPRIRPLPGDPELPDEEEEEENEKKKKEPEKDPDDPEQDPEKPEPAKPPGER